MGGVKTSLRCLIYRKNTLKNMKKVIAMLCLSMLFFSACQKEGTTRLRVQIAPPASDSKDYIDANNHAWFHNGDKILINGIAYRMTKATDGSYFVDVDEEMLDANPNSYDVIYPATNVSYDRSNHIYNFTMRANEQYYVEDISGKQRLNAIMAGSVNAESSTITLHNVASLLRVKVPSDFTEVTSISVTAVRNSDSKNAFMSGDYKINLSNTGNTPVLEKVNGKLQQVVLVCPQETRREDLTYYVVLPPSTVEGVNLKYKVSVYGEILMNGTLPVKAYAERIQKGFHTLGANHIGDVVFNNDSIHENSLPFLYTVASSGGVPTKKVRFSAGNLQWKYAGTHQFVSTIGSGSRQGTWRFAPHQYDICGKDDNEKIANLSVAANQNVWIDLFGYATSQFDNSTYAQPNACTGKHKDYGIAGGSNATIDYDHDWGRNIISNADNNLQWYTMSGEEWAYVCSNDGVRDSCNSAGTIKLDGGGEIHGVILLPDSSGIVKWNDYCNPISCKPFVAEHWSDFNANVYTEAQWSDMEAMGAIFLPCAGRRGTEQEATTTVTMVNEALFQWSSSPASSKGQGNTSGEVVFDPQNKMSNNWTTFRMASSDKDRANGLTVRLAYEVPKSQW